MKHKVTFLFSEPFNNSSKIKNYTKTMAIPSNQQSIDRMSTDIGSGSLVGPEGTPIIAVKIRSTNEGQPLELSNNTSMP